MPTPETRRQGVYWIITLSTANSPVEPKLSYGVVWAKGQKEVGNGGFEHWQFVAAFKPKASLRVVQRCFPSAHAELTRSEAAIAYCFKEDTRVEGTQFERI